MNLDSTALSARSRDLIIVMITFALISYFHYFPLHLDFMAHDTFHILLRRLYYVPIIYAALRFGIAGGLGSSVAATILFAPHAAASMGGFTGTSVDNLFDVILFNVVGFSTGLVVNSRRRQGQRYQEVVKLNKEIEDRESSIRHMQTYTESVLSSVYSGVISCDRRGIIVTANPAARRMLGLSEEDIIAFPLTRIFTDNPEIGAAAQLVLGGERGRATFEVKLPAPERNGRKLTVAVRVTPHRSRGRNVGAVISLEDLTEVRNLTDQLMRADRLTGLGELVGGVAHEVRNPLGVIRASVQMIEQEMDQGCQSGELTQVMIQEIDRLDSLVRALLEFGRPSESRFQLVEPRQTLDEVVLLTKQFARTSGVTVEANLDDLPAITADENRLKQVFVNLITNAIQAMPDGGALRIFAAENDGFVEITFADSGAGIAPDEQARIFDPFHTTRAEGTGLGLSIVHRIVDAHGGFIRVESEPGNGASFTVRLPVAKTAPGSGRAQSDKKNPSGELS